MNAVNALPTKRPDDARGNAADQRWRVFARVVLGMKAYMKVNTMVTMT